MASYSQKCTVLQAEDGRKLTVLGQEITVKLTCHDTGGNYFLFEDVVPAGLGVPPHLHEREDEILEILEGDFEVLLDGQTFQAQPGTIAYFPRNIVHGFRNSGTTTGRAKFFVSPGDNFERFFEELSQLPADQPPDMEKVGKIFDRYAIRIMGA